MIDWLEIPILWPVLIAAVVAPTVIVLGSILWVVERFRR
jgi:hypothetical protein